MFGRIGGGSKSGGSGSHESKSGGSICGIDRKDIRSVIHVSTTNKNDFKAVFWTEYILWFFNNDVTNVELD